MSPYGPGPPAFSLQGPTPKPGSNARSKAGGAWARFPVAGASRFASVPRLHRPRHGKVRC